MSVAHRPPPKASWLGMSREVPLADPLGAGTEGLSVYWEVPGEAEAFAGFGVAGELRSMLAAEAAQVRWLGEAPHLPGPWWGGVAFEPAQVVEPRWAGFGAERWLLPASAVARRGGRTFLLAFEAEETAADPAQLLGRRLDALAARLERATPPKLLPTNGALRVGCGPPTAHWNALVGAALAGIGRGQFSKVVVARTMDLSLEAPLDAVRVLGALRLRHPACATFCFVAPGGAVFLGATPEILLRAEGGALQTEALAGTLPAGASLCDAGDKEQREHRAVVDGIRKGLLPRVRSLELDPQPSLVRLSGLCHLRTGIRATLAEDASLAEIALLLHPTAAVAGESRGPALDFIRESEGFDRGWYAGLVGWMGKGSAHLRVALRSALVEGRGARLFAGAGIVSGSVAEAEWAETGLKAGAMLEALGGQRRLDAAG